MGKTNSDCGNERLLGQLRSDGGSNVVHIGAVPDDSLSAWENSVTREIVVTKPQRDHWRERHPEIESEEPTLLQMLVDPMEIHRDSTDPMIAAFYDELSDGRYLRASVWVSNRDDRQNSVLSVRYARRRELDRGRRTGLLVWTRRDD